MNNRLGRFSTRISSYSSIVGTLANPMASSIAGLAAVTEAVTEPLVMVGEATSMASVILAAASSR